ITHRIQIALAKTTSRGPRADDPALETPLPLQLLRRVPVLRRIPARLVGMGVRPEHVRSPEVRTAADNGAPVPNAAPYEALALRAPSILMRACDSCHLSQWILSVLIM